MDIGFMHKIISHHKIQQCLFGTQRNSKKNNPMKTAHLISNKNDTISTDFLFHSILDLSEIKGFNFKKEKSIFYKRKEETN